MAFETDSPAEREDQRQMAEGIKRLSTSAPDPAQKRRALAERIWRAAWAALGSEWDAEQQRWIAGTSPIAAIERVLAEECE